MQNPESFEEGLCPQCGAVLRSEWTPPNYVVLCSDCEWAIATSRFPPIFDDDQIYEVWLCMEATSALKAIVHIKRYLAVNTVEAMEIVRQGESVFLFKGRATEIWSSIQEIQKVEGIRIEPEFPYEEGDLMGMKLA